MTRLMKATMALTLAAGLLLTACGSDSNGDTKASSSPSTTTAGKEASTSGAAATVKVADNPKFGKLLVGADGRTLYLFEKDSGTTTACTGGCVDNWPALTATSPTGGDGVDQSKLSTADGEKPNQVVYNGHLLYYFAGDKAAGDVNGAGIPAWYPVNPSGDKIDND
jgi:predicted lipoprotein with Yx(FWY)xxD motif